MCASEPEPLEHALPQVMPPLLKALQELRAIDKSSIAELKVRPEAHVCREWPPLPLLKQRGFVFGCAFIA